MIEAKLSEHNWLPHPGCGWKKSGVRLHHLAPELGSLALCLTTIGSLTFCLTTIGTRWKIPSTQTTVASWLLKSENEGWTIVWCSSSSRLAGDWHVKVVFNSGGFFSSGLGEEVSEWRRGTPELLASAMLSAGLVVNVVDGVFDLVAFGQFWTVSEITKVFVAWIRECYFSSSPSSLIPGCHIGCLSSGRND